MTGQAKYRPSDFPIRGERAGRMFDDMTAIETEIERRRQYVIAEERRLLIERLRREPES